MRTGSQVVVPYALSFVLSACAADAAVYRPTTDSGRKGDGPNAGDPVLARPPGRDSRGSAAGLDAANAGSPSTRGTPARRPPGGPRPWEADPTRPFGVAAAAAPDNPAGLSDAEVTQLMAAKGGPSDTMKWLYPYEGTVFPRGTVAPLVMWHSDAAPDVVYFRMRSPRFDYKGVLFPTVGDALFLPRSALLAPSMQLKIPQDVWNAAGERSQGRGETFELELTARVKGQVHGPIKSSIIIAQAAVKGSIYYNACLPGLEGGGDALDVGGRVLRIPPGGNAEPVSEQGQCLGCHSVSADGSRVVVQRGPVAADPSAIAAPGMPVVTGVSYQLDPHGKSDPGTAKTLGTMGSFGALYPDGSKYLTTTGALAIAVSAARWGPIPAPASSALYDTTTGEVVPNTAIPAGAAMPMFSPDGKHLVFTDQALGFDGLSMMDYDTQNHKATNTKALVPANGVDLMRPGWPFFLPDNKAVVFSRTKNLFDFSSGAPGGAPAIAVGINLGAQPMAPGHSDLYIVDVTTGIVTLLARAMGFNTPEDAAVEKAYLPLEAGDLHHNYYPTVSPAAAGGYFWVFFESWRRFGNLGVRRLLWGFAIDVRSDGNYALDPSHPPFYVPGQEFVLSTHHRAFAALDRCRQDGAPCKTGIDCCGGTCALPTDPSAEFVEPLEPLGTCSQPMPNTCAHHDERCETSADCCGPSASCINRFCAFVELP